MELLRIVAMMLILFGHTHIRLHTIEYGQEQMSMVPFFNTMMACISTIGVGLFISISGWFGIKFKTKGLLKYLYYVLFTLWAVYGITIANGITGLNLYGIKVSLGFYEGYWFIIGYLGLYLISPILNLFMEHATKKEYKIVLLSYFLFQACYSWLSAWYDYYDGYSIIMFGGIYLTAAYIRKYPVGLLYKHSNTLIIATLLLMSCVAYISLQKFGHAARQIRDDNPLVILLSILFVISFSKLQLQSQIINWLAGSCFAVYLVHFSPFVYPYLMQGVKTIYIHFDGVIYASSLFLLFIAVYIACTLFDQIRILTWNLMCKCKRGTRTQSF